MDEEDEYADTTLPSRRGSYSKPIQPPPETQMLEPSKKSSIAQQIIAKSKEKAAAEATPKTPSPTHTSVTPVEEKKGVKSPSKKSSSKEKEASSKGSKETNETPTTGGGDKKAAKNNKRLARFLTAVGYVLSVSMAAIVMGFYYLISWSPYEDSEILQDDTNSSQNVTGQNNAV